MHKKYIWGGIALAIVIVVGTIGYWFIGEGHYSFLDCLYMTVITITTIGYSEIIDFSGSIAGRVFTIFVALSGIGTLAYMLTSLTATIVEGELTASFRRRRMEKTAKKAQGHYIVCGMGRSGLYIVNELRETNRDHVIIDTDGDKINKSLKSMSNETFIEGNATDNNILLKAGIEKANGLFAVTGDDNQNIVICLKAKQLNNTVRLVAKCNEMKNLDTMNRVGADAVVSPGYISGMRMASEMIRPTVVDFLDKMLRDRDVNLRVEEVAIPSYLVGKNLLSAINFKKYRHTLLLAVKEGENWVYNPPRDSYVLVPGNRLIIMTTPEEGKELEKDMKEEK